MGTLSNEQALSVKNRVFETLDDQRISFNWIKEGKPLKAEENTNRKLAYIQR